MIAERAELVWFYVRIYADDASIPSRPQSKGDKQQQQARASIITRLLLAAYLLSRSVLWGYAANRRHNIVKLGLLQ